MKIPALGFVLSLVYAYCSQRQSRAFMACCWRDWDCWGWSHDAEYPTKFVKQKTQKASNAGFLFDDVA